MKLIINIDEDLKSAIYNCGLFLNPTDKLTLINAINNGIPLPKGHGDLKDTQDIINKLNLNYNNHQTISEQSIKDIIQTIPTIIEADKGE